MARCRCGATQCPCALQSGYGIEVSGEGSQENPWIITGIGVNIGVVDTATLNLTISGIGTPDNPYMLRGDVSIGEPGALAIGPGLDGDGTGLDPLRIDLCTYGDLRTACAP
jgi:hypothetical protein